MKVEASQETAERLARVVSSAATFLDSQYFNLGKKTIPLYNAMEDTWQALTDEDRAFLRDVAKRDQS